MTREDARYYFKELGLTYADISRTDLYLLSALLDLYIVRDRCERMAAGEPLYWVRVNPAKDYRGEWAENGAMIHARMTAKGEYFSARQVISFNRDGFIGFCGDADDNNLKPVLDAFVAWCDELAAIKEIGKGDADDGGS